MEIKKKLKKALEGLANAKKVLEKAGAYLLDQISIMFLGYISFIVPLFLFLATTHAAKIAILQRNPEIYWKIAQFSITIGSLLIVAASFFKELDEQGKQNRTFRLSIFWLLGGFVALANYLLINISKATITLPATTEKFMIYGEIYLESSYPYGLTGALIYISSTYLLYILNDFMSPDTDYFIVGAGKKAKSYISHKT